MLASFFKGQEFLSALTVSPSGFFYGNTTSSFNLLNATVAARLFQFPLITARPIGYANKSASSSPAIALAFFAKAHSGGSREKGVLIVIGVLLPLVVAFDFLEGSGLEWWIVMPMIVAICTYLAISFIGDSQSGSSSGFWGDSGDGDNGDGGDGGGED